MDVQHAVSEGSNELRTGDPHVACERDDVDGAVTQDFDERVIERRTVGEAVGIDVHGLDRSSPRPIEGIRVRTVGDHQGHPGADDRVVEERLKVRPRARREHGHPSGHVAHAREPVPSLSTRPRDREGQSERSPAGRVKPAHPPACDRGWWSG